MGKMHQKAAICKIWPYHIPNYYKVYIKTFCEKIAQTGAQPIFCQNQYIALTVGKSILKIRAAPAMEYV
jgi:hypothetical protein